MKKVFSKLFLPAVLLIFLALYCSKGLFKYYSFSTHDGDHHIARSFDVIVTLREGHFPLRWAGSLNNYCGVPIYNFFYPLIYYLVFLINFLTKDVMFSLKIIYASTFIIAPIFFYFWLLKETKSWLASFTGAVLYLFVPYRFLLIFVRNSPEFMTYTILPILLYLISSLFEQKIEGKNIFQKGFLTAIVGGLLVISHNFAAMFLMPILALFILYKTILSRFKNKRKMAFLLFVFLSFFGLGAFFLGPALVEQGNVKLSSLPTIDYKEHFPTLWQLVRSPWGYFYSSPGVENDGMSFMLGYAQWLVLGFSAVLLLKTFKEHRSKRKWFSKNFVIIFWFSISLAVIFLISQYSIFIWEKIKILQKIQFSWRFLGVTSFTIAALGGFFLSQTKNKFILGILAFILIFFAIVGNRNHLLPQPVNNIDWYYHFEALHPHRYSTTTFADDILNKESLRSCKPKEPFVSEPGKSAKLDYNIARGNTFGKVVFKSLTKTTIDIKLNLEFFPGAYKILLNNAAVDNYENYKGKIFIKNASLFVGNNTIEWKIVQTPVQKIFNSISFSFLICWLLVISFGKNIFKGLYEK